MLRFVVPRLLLAAVVAFGPWALARGFWAHFSPRALRVTSGDFFGDLSLWGLLRVSLETWLEFVAEALENRASARRPGWRSRLALRLFPV